MADDATRDGAMLAGGGTTLGTPEERDVDRTQDEKIASNLEQEGVPNNIKDAGQLFVQALKEKDSYLIPNMEPLSAADMAAQLSQLLFPPVPSSEFSSTAESDSKPQEPPADQEADHEKPNTVQGEVDPTSCQAPQPARERSANGRDQTQPKGETFQPPSPMRSSQKTDEEPEDAQNLQFNPVGTAQAVSPYGYPVDWMQHAYLQAMAAWSAHLQNAAAGPPPPWGCPAVRSFQQMHAYPVLMGPYNLFDWYLQQFRMLTLQNQAAASALLFLMPALGDVEDDDVNMAALKEQLQQVQLTQDLLPAAPQAGLPDAHKVSEDTKNMKIRMNHSEPDSPDVKIYVDVQEHQLSPRSKEPPPTPRPPHQHPPFYPQQQQQLQQQQSLPPSHQQKKQQVQNITSPPPPHQQQRQSPVLLHQQQQQTIPLSPPSQYQQQTQVIVSPPPLQKQPYQQQISSQHPSRQTQQQHLPTKEKSYQSDPETFLSLNRRKSEHVLIKSDREESVPGSPVAKRQHLEFPKIFSGLKMFPCPSKENLPSSRGPEKTHNRGPNEPRRSTEESPTPEYCLFTPVVFNPNSLPPPDTFGNKQTTSLTTPQVPSTAIPGPSQAGLGYTQTSPPGNAPAAGLQRKIPVTMTTGDGRYLQRQRENHLRGQGAQQRSPVQTSVPKPPQTVPQAPPQTSLRVPPQAPPQAPPKALLQDLPEASPQILPVAPPQTVLEVMAQATPASQPRVPLVAPPQVMLKATTQSSQAAPQDQLKFSSCSLSETPSARRPIQNAFRAVPNKDELQQSGPRTQTPGQTAQTDGRQEMQGKQLSASQQLYLSQQQPTQLQSQLSQMQQQQQQQQYVTSQRRQQYTGHLHPSAAEIPQEFSKLPMNAHQQCGKYLHQQDLSPQLQYQQKYFPQHQLNTRQQQPPQICDPLSNRLTSPPIQQYNQDLFTHPSQVKTRGPVVQATPPSLPPRDLGASLPQVFSINGTLDTPPRHMAPQVTHRRGHGPRGRSDPGMLSPLMNAAPGHMSPRYPDMVGCEHVNPVFGSGLSAPVPTSVKPEGVQPKNHIAGGYFVGIRDI